MATIRIIASSRNEDASSLAAKLKAKGMNVQSIMGAIGAVTGEIAESNLPALQALPGVTVEREDVVRLNPPDAPVQ